MVIITNTLILLAHGVPGLVVAGITMILMLLGLIRKDMALMFFAAFLLIPFSYTYGGWSGFRLFVRLLMLFPLGSAFAIGKGDAIFAWSLPMPVFGYLIYLLFKILSSGFVGVDPMYIY
jgi:hypothetical protein